MRRRGLPFAFVLLLGVLLAQAGCAAGPTVLIGGTVLGDTLSGASAGATDPVAARVSCNGVATTAAADGSYTLRVPQAKHYTCQAAKPPAYGAEVVQLGGTTKSTIQLDFGASHSPACRLDVLSFAVECEQLHFQPGILRGTVTYAHGSAPAANITVQCPDLAHFNAAQQNVSWLHAKTDASGTFTLANIAAGTYTCLARTTQGDMTAQQVTVQPGGAVQANFQVCGANCPPVHYHFGDVMHRYHAYLIFWQPNGVTYEPGGSDSRFTSLVQRYFRDVGGTPFYNILAQYWDYAGFVQNSATLAGTWRDTAPYQHCTVGQTACTAARADRSDPLLDGDIQAEITRAISANPGWQAGSDNEFVVFTGYGAEECFTADTTSDCSYKTDHGYCGYHSAFHPSTSASANTSTTAAPEAIYAYVPDAANDGGLCTFSSFTSPNHDAVADSTINIASHEQFESISDPLPQDAPGWLDDNAAQSREGGEIGDKCVRYYGTVRGDGSNVTLANGDRYLLQGEWSNAADACALSA
ncbi:MAG: carboxypeptidase-like regulatory domain-containing protein [Ktedonobacterales bacterium]